jgi:hypothetical protein
MVKFAALGGLAAVLSIFMATAPAQARNLYFDIWCVEQGHDQARCDERRPEDVALFEEYWRGVERYEESYFVAREDYKNFRDELNELDEAATPGFRTYDPERSPRPE